MHAKRRDEILSDAHGNILLDVDLLRSAREEERANKFCGLKPRESRLAEYESKKIKKSYSYSILYHIINVTFERRYNTLYDYLACF